MHTTWRWLVPVVAVLFSTPSLAEEEKTQPAEVTVGVFVNQIHEFSLHDNSFTVDFYVWFRWKDPDLKPYETYAVVDGRIESKTDAVVKQQENGEFYAYQQVVAKITRFFDIARFPLDNHDLTVAIEEEDSETHLLIYKADEENSAARPGIELPGWVFQRLSTTAGVTKYTTNFGDTSLPKNNESHYSRVTTAVTFTRTGGTYFFKLFLGLWTCIIAAVLSFWIRPPNVDPRFGLPIGALFGAIGSQYTIAGILPDTNSITLADKLHLWAFAFIMVALVQGTVSLWLFESEKQAAAHRLDVMFRWIVPAAWVLTTVWVLL